MSELLPREFVEQYRRDGLFFPIRVLSPAELRHKSHLLFTWLDTLVRHPAIRTPSAAWCTRAARWSSRAGSPSTAPA